MRVKFRDKSVIVTAGSSGIGLACVQRFVREGARVVNLDVKPPASETMSQTNGPQATWIEADLGRPQVIRTAIEQALRLLDGVDVLVNNAAYTAHRGGGVLDTNLQEWQRQMDITATGTFLVSQACLPSMIQRGRGAIINISSIGGVRPFANAAAYCTAKAAVIQLTRSIAVDYGRRGIRCNAVCPGAIDTPAFRSIRDDSYELADREARTALGRIGQPDEIASVAAFLASEESSYMTGTVLTADGGWDACQWSDRLGPRS